MGSFIGGIGTGSEARSFIQRSACRRFTLAALALSCAITFTQRSSAQVGIFWQGGVGDWFNSANWGPLPNTTWGGGLDPRIPGPNDDATAIGVLGATLQIGTGNATAWDVELYSANLDISGGNLDVGTDVYFDSVNLALSGGSLNVANRVYLYGGSVSQTGGQLATGDDLRVATHNSASYTLSNGGLTVTHQEIIGLTPLGTGEFNQKSGTNTCWLLWVGGSPDGNTNFSGTTGTYNLVSGNLNIAAGGEVIGGNATGGNGNGTFTQTGGIHSVAGELTINAGGALNLQGGTLSTGPFTVNSGGTFNIQQPAPSITFSTDSIANSGMISVVTSSNTTINVSDITNSGGTISVVGNGGGSINVRGIVNSGKLSITGSNGGNISITKHGYIQTSGGELDVELTNDLKINPAIALTGGGAQLDGKLRVTEAADVFPSLGDRFHIMSYQSVQGRFTTFSGSVIPNDSTKFLGLDYRSGMLDVITLETPLRVSPSGFLTTPLSSSGHAKNLLLVTHGTNASIHDAGSWVVNLASQLASNLDSQSGGWDVVALDWSQYAGNILDFVNGAAEPDRMGYEVGRSMASYLESLGYVSRSQGQGYQNIHVLGHSAGSWVVSGLSDKLKEDGASSAIDVSMFDADSNTSHFLPTLPYGPLGASADYGEQFVDHRPLTIVPLGLDPTNATLAGATNLDVTLLDSASYFSVNYWNPIHRHAWPYIWYTTTVGVPETGPAAFGYPHSYESGGFPPAYGLYDGVNLQPGARYYLTPKGIRLSPRWFGIDLNYQTNIISDTGTVDVNANGGATLKTGSPVLLTSLVTLSDPANLLEFNFQFESDAQGLLSIFFDGQEIMQIDEQDVSKDLLSSGDIWLGNDFSPGTYALLFRLDPYSDVQSVVDISDIQFGYAAPVGVPEPSALVLLSALVSLFQLRPLRKRIAGALS